MIPPVPSTQTTFTPYRHATSCLCLSRCSAAQQEPQLWPCHLLRKTRTDSPTVSFLGEVVERVGSSEDSGEHLDGWRDRRCGTSGMYGINSTQWVDFWPLMCCLCSAVSCKKLDCLCSHVLPALLHKRLVTRGHYCPSPNLFTARVSKDKNGTLPTYNMKTADTLLLRV